MTDSTTPAPQGTYHFIIAVQKPLPSGGYTVADWSGWFTPDPAWTRHDAFQWIKAEHARERPELAGGTTIFFPLEPNQL